MGLDAEYGPEQSLVFKEEVITLDIPIEGRVQDDWKVLPLTPPKVRNQTIGCFTGYHTCNDSLQ